MRNPKHLIGGERVIIVLHIGERVVRGQIGVLIVTPIQGRAESPCLRLVREVVGAGDQDHSLNQARNSICIHKLHLLPEANESKRTAGKEFTASVLAGAASAYSELPR